MDAYFCQGFHDMTITVKAFAEDKTMIGAQQRSVDLVPGRRFIATAAAKGVVLFKRLAAKLAG